MMATDLRPTDRFTNLTRGVRAFPVEVGIPQGLAVSAGAGFRKARTNGQQRHCLWVSGTSLPVLIGSQVRVQAFNRDQ
jgi:hypothetical protein